MRRIDREINSFDEIVEIVSRCDTIRIGLHDGDFPYVVPVSFGFEVLAGKLVLYFHGAKRGKKVELLEKNPRICVEGDRCNRFFLLPDGEETCAYESFIGFGRAVLLSGNEAGKGLRLLLEHCGFASYEVAPQRVSGTQVYKVVLDTVTGKRNRQSGSGIDD